MRRDDKREAEEDLIGEASPLNLAAVGDRGDERLRRVLADAEVSCRVLLPQLAAMFLVLEPESLPELTERNGSVYGLPSGPPFSIGPL